MKSDNKIEYIATDERPPKDPVGADHRSAGVVTEYRTPKFTNDISQL